MAKNNDWKKRDGVVYSTSNDFEFSYQHQEESVTLVPEKQHLKVMLDKSMRAGKKVTLVTDFVGSNEDLEKLGKLLKKKCGVGGSVKSGEIIIQGDHRDKVINILKQANYRAKRVG